MITILCPGRMKLLGLCQGLALTFVCLRLISVRFLHSLPLGSQIIAVPVNSSLSWHINKLRDPGKEAYNVSYAWKMVRRHSSLILLIIIHEVVITFCDGTMVY